MPFTIGLDSSASTSVITRTNSTPHLMLYGASYQYTASEDDYIDTVGFYAGTATGDGSGIEIGLYNVTSGVASAPLVWSQVITAFTPSARNTMSVTPFYLTAGNLYVVAIRVISATNIGLRDGYGGTASTRVSTNSGTVALTTWANSGSDEYPIPCFVTGDNAPAAPAINPTGTDTDLINGTSADVVFSGLTSDPASIEVVWDNGVDSAISSTQADYSLGTVTAGVAAATVTATIGNLPYTDATYLTADYSYLVTCDDDSEITFDTLTLAPETGNSFITVASPVNDSTSILPSETLANGQQLEWPDEVVISESNTATLDVLADGQFTIEWSGAAASFTFTLRFWDGSEWFDIATTINTAGEVVSGGGLTRVGLTRVGLTTAGLTAAGL